MCVKSNLYVVLSLISQNVSSEVVVINMCLHARVLLPCNVEGVKLILEPRRFETTNLLPTTSQHLGTLNSQLNTVCYAITMKYVLTAVMY